MPIEDKEQREKYMRAWRANRRRKVAELKVKGLCHCGEPLLTATMCLYHAEQKRKKSKRVRDREQPGGVRVHPYTCTACKKPGHNRRTCPDLVTQNSEG